MLELYYDDTGTRLLGGAEYEANGEGWMDEAIELEEYIYEGDLLRYILFHGMENGEIYEELTLFARAHLIWSGDVVNTEQEPGIPAGITLGQNYPNPFNPSTQIVYDLPDITDVRLDVYSIQGQHVATLVNTVQNAGTHTLTFDARNLASGVYFYRLKAGNEILTRKMTLIK